MRFSFGPLLQLEMDNFVSEWNSHRIRKSNLAEVPSGISNVLFHFPELHGKFFKSSEFTILMGKNIGVQDHLCSVEASTIHEVEQLFCETPRLVSSEFENFAQAVMEEFAIPNPNSIDESLELFLKLTCILD